MFLEEMWIVDIIKIKTETKKATPVKPQKTSKKITSSN